MFEPESGGIGGMANGVFIGSLLWNAIFLACSWARSPASYNSR